MSMSWDTDEALVSNPRNPTPEERLTKTPKTSAEGDESARTLATSYVLRQIHTGEEGRRQLTLRATSLLLAVGAISQDL